MDESEDCTGCVKEFIGGNGPAKNTLTATMQDGMPYVLPPWRVNEIILLVIETLSEREYYKEDFDYKKMISDMGIKLKKFSSFNPENLEKFTQISLSLWNEGVCAVFPDPVTGAIGAVALHPGKNLVIIDMGTATTIDCVTKNSEYLGGAILSGLRISMEALATGTAKLPSVEISKPDHVCGTSTIEAIQSGLFYGNAGALKEFIYLYEKNVFKGEKPYVLGTGGFSRIFEQYNLFNEISPELILLGVKKALELNN